MHLYTPSYADEDDAHPSPAMVKRRRTRADGEIRPVSAEMGVLSSSSGSTMFCTGDTKVLVAVFGPFPATGSGSDGSDAMATGTLHCEVALAPGAAPAHHELLRGTASGTNPAATSAPTATQPSDALREMAILLRAALEPAVRLSELPKCAVHVRALILQVCSWPRP